MGKESGNAFDFRLFKRLLKYTNPYRLTLYFVAFSAIALSAFGVLRPILLKLTIDESIVNTSMENLIFYVSLMIGVLIFEVIFQFCFIYYANWLGQEVIRDLRVNLFRHMLKFRMAYFDKSAVGRLVTRAVSDIETIAGIFSQGLFMIIADLLKMVAVLGVMLYWSWKLTLIVLIVLPFILYATRIFQKKMKSAFEEVRTQVSNLNSFVQERITGMKIVQIFAREETEYKNFKVINDKHRKGWIKTVWYNSIFFPIAEIASSITIGLIFWYGGLRVLESDAISLGVIVMFMELVQMFFRPLRQIADKFNTLQMGMVATNRVFGILDTHSSIDDEGSTVLSGIKGDISFKDVKFSYVEHEEVLKGISFDAEAGETIAIVGATGAGKSTVINLLSRLYDIKSGEILVDGINIKDATLVSLRKEIAVVLQDVFLFADTILNNITLNNPEVTEEQVIQASKEIGVHDFISTLPNGYHYNVKERGVMLSSGQRQLIAFLRAYVSNPSILVLDEATSSVDSYSEQLIQDATDKITKGRTSIVIAHRLATIKKADRILVMDAGKIVEQGTHKQLLKKENGYYKNLYEVQFMEEAI
ncbi:ABC transporter ATP-binding protein [Croceibacter atlanticus]|jgi:ATP-binding cassette subfamily B multidrug efflux pump|uniref:ATPase n=1 Tax=Croceibacter atlanticus (strain ATCC BAA-628 / JCM 21780 / CIP 108009 / IAM 15332 / KCTC 12090 / HTCC2559) TaxID=216432 RepID=A3UB76_CROAH|nr:ABC transporter ATP-binding protein [Croceibacter atlanticus]EAP87062.1 ATPase [Croceibacter atlanticus HTCC2559]MBW4971247.1 ABC transporter ATP-binding protein/permease [Croceibacter atlanticus]